MKIRDKNTEKRILKAAIKLFGDKGYFKTTVDDIAHAAGIAKGTIYLYFRNKEAIYVGTCVEQFDQVMENIVAKINAAKTAEVQLSGIAHYLSAYVNRIRTLYPLFNLENIHLSARTLKGLRAVVMPKMVKMNDTIAEVISQGVRNKEFRQVDPQTAAFMFINLIRSLFMGVMFKLDSSTNINEIMHIFLEGIKRRQNV